MMTTTTTTTTTTATTTATTTKITMMTVMMRFGGWDASWRGMCATFTKARFAGETEHPGGKGTAKGEKKE